MITFFVKINIIKIIFSNFYCITFRIIFLILDIRISVASRSPFPTSQGTIPDFAFCDAAGISEDMVSYISHELYPYGLGKQDGNPDHLGFNLAKQDEYSQGFKQLLLQYNDTIDILDAVTRDCSELSLFSLLQSSWYLVCKTQTVL